MTKQVISRELAKSLKLKRYFTGIPCRRGHTDERRVSNWGCVVCLRLNQATLISTSPAFKAAQKNALKKWRSTERGRTSTRKIYKRARATQKYKDRMRRPSRRIHAAMSRRLGTFIRKGGVGTSKIIREKCGYEIGDLISHLERQFTKGMTWDNYGVHGWHIDHIIPASSFNMTVPSDFRACWALANLRPCWANENSAKGAKLVFLL